MEHQEILNFLNKPSDSKFVIKSGTLSMINQTQFDVGNEIIYNKEALKFTLCDYNDAYFLSKR